MGTNFYFFKEAKPKEVQPEEGLHIGKLSYGWVFHFQAYPEKALTTYYQWKECTKHGFIYNEYNEFHSYIDFWETVEASKEVIECRTPLSFDNCEDAKMDGVNEYMSNGFMFTENDFS